jgi:purine nucleosidase
VEKIDLIIDTDPGADDVIALLFALASPDELNIHALTTVAGNVRLDKTSRNARLAREWAGREDVPVYAGAPTPLQRTPIHAEDIHGKEACRVSSCTNRRKVWPRAVRSTS